MIITVRFRDRIRGVDTIRKARNYIAAFGFKFNGEVNRSCTGKMLIESQRKRGDARKSEKERLCCCPRRSQS